jgi:DNA mismatch repair protein MSH4
MQQSQQSINNVLKLKSFAQAVPILYRALAGAQSKLLVEIRSICHPANISQTLQIIRDVINDDVTYEKAPLGLRNQKTYAVKVYKDTLILTTTI